jgi:hypothetical protein
MATHAASPSESEPPLTSCPSLFVSPAGFTLEGYLGYEVTDKAYQRLAGKLHVDGDSLFFFPLMEEPVALAQGEPPVFEPEVRVDVGKRRIVLTYALAQSKRGQVDISY